MCGIFGYIGFNKNAAELTLEGLKKLEYRGYDSWGVAVVDSDRISLRKKIGKIGNATVSDLPLSTIGLGHTRWATHGGVTDLNAHPHLSKDKTIALVHNGIIENYEEIKHELIAKGYEFISETDTEVAVYLIEELRKTHSFMESVRLAFMRFEGLNAIIALDAKSQEFVAVKSGSPLVVGLGSGEQFLASDAAALLSHTRTVHFLEDFELVVVRESGATLYDAETGNEKELNTAVLTWKEEDADKVVYVHFMMKEIMEQPEVLRRIAVSQREEIGEIAALIKSSYGMYMTGCGTAAYACLAGTYLFSKIAKRHVNFAVGSEFGYLTDFLTPESLVMALSQSGETIDIIESIKKAQSKNAKIVAAVNVVGSTLYRMSDRQLELLAGPEKAVASTKAFVAKVALLTLLAHTVADTVSEGIELIEHAAFAIEAVLSSSIQKQIEQVVEKLQNKSHLYSIGRGISYPLALEAALKIKEVSYMHAEGLAAGELKHGAIALIETGTPCMVFAPLDETYSANLAGAMEMKARGGFIIGISPKESDVFDVHIPVADCKHLTILPMVVVAQLFAYAMAVIRGLDPDKPRNLAKSVTVK